MIFRDLLYIFRGQGNPKLFSKVFPKRLVLGLRKESFPSEKNECNKTETLSRWTNVIIIYCVLMCVPSKI